MSDNRPVLFEVQMLNAVGGPGRYRVLRNEPGRLIFEWLEDQWGPESAPRWNEVQARDSINALILLGEDSGLLEKTDSGHLTRGSVTEALERANSALFVAPLLAPCGSCGDWNPIAAETCVDCSKDPRRIVEPCEVCDGEGAIDANALLSVNCPSCRGDKTETTAIGRDRWKYLQRCMDAKILTSGQAHGAIIEE